MAVLGKMRSAARMDGRSWALVAEALAALVAARARSLLPFKILARQLGGIVPPPVPAPGPVPAAALAELVPDPSLSNDQQTAIRRIRWAIGAVEAWLPFRTLCLQQAIAARAMLARRGIGSVLHLGVDATTGAGLKAHAWLDAGGQRVTGYPIDPGLREVGRFVGQHAAAPISRRSPSTDRSTHMDERDITRT